MSYEHESDYWEEMAMESLYSDFRQDPDTRASFYEELYDEIVQDFTAGRLRSYFTEHPDLVAPAAQALTDARALLSVHQTAGFMFGAIAVEVTLRAVLLRPIVYGLVHSETAASLITRLAIAHRDEKFTKVLLDLLASFGGVDPRTKYRVEGGPKLWDEMGRIRDKRNHVVHQAEMATEDEAQLAVAVAACMIGSSHKCMHDLAPGRSATAVGRRCGCARARYAAVQSSVAQLTAACAGPALGGGPARRQPDQTQAADSMALTWPRTVKASGTRPRLSPMFCAGAERSLTVQPPWNWQPRHDSGVCCGRTFREPATPL